MVTLCLCLAFLGTPADVFEGPIVERHIGPGLYPRIVVDVSGAGRTVYLRDAMAILGAGRPMSRYGAESLYVGMRVRFTDHDGDSMDTLEILDDPTEDILFELAVSDFIMGTLPPELFEWALMPHTRHLVAQLDATCWHCRTQAFDAIIGMGEPRATLIAAWAKLSRSAEVRNAGGLLEGAMVGRKLPKTYEFEGVIVRAE